MLVRKAHVDEHAVLDVAAVALRKAYQDRAHTPERGQRLHDVREVMRPAQPGRDRFKDGFSEPSGTSCEILRRLACGRQ